MKHKLMWPGHRRGALMSTWDDGTIFDRKLVAIFDRHGLKGTFALNSGFLGLSAQASGWRDYVRAEEVKTLYARHEINSHTVQHPHLWHLSGEAMRWQFTEDRRRLEALVGYPVRGAVIPFGWETGAEHMARVFEGLGFRYARFTHTTLRCEWPANFLSWHPTAHCGADLDALWKTFAGEMDRGCAPLLNVWGHSFEFEDAQRWDSLEAFAAQAGTHAQVWHATAGEVYDYLTAWRNLSWSCDGATALNTSAVSLCLEYDKKPVTLAPGECRNFEAS